MSTPMYPRQVTSEVELTDTEWRMLRVSWNTRKAIDHSPCPASKENEAIPKQVMNHKNRLQDAGIRREKGWLRLRSQRPGLVERADWPMRDGRHSMPVSVSLITFQLRKASNGRHQHGDEAQPDPECWM